MRRSRPVTLSVLSSLTAALAAGLLSGTAPVAAGAEREPAVVPRGGEPRPLHSSDRQPGRWAPVVPQRLQFSRSTAPVRSEVAPGVTLTQWSELDARGPQRFHLLTVDPTEPGLLLDYAGPSRVAATATVPRLLAPAGDAAVAGVNGDFFDIGDTGAPLGVGRDQQRGLLHARQYGWNASFTVDAQGRPDIGTVPLRAAVAQHPGWKVTNLNSPFVQPGAIGVYTAAWGRTSGYRVTSGQRRNVRMVLVRGGRVVRTRAKLSKGDAIRGTLLIGRGQGARQLGRLRKGSPVTVRYRLEGAPRMAISGNKLLVDEGVVAVVDDREMHPRTAVGIDRDTGEVLLLVVDGRQQSSRGATMVELAATMVDLGADEALNLDGGGSSTMVTRRADGRLGVVNSPSDGTLRSVANALQVTWTPPAG